MQITLDEGLANQNQLKARTRREPDEPTYDKWKYQSRWAHCNCCILHICDGSNLVIRGCDELIKLSLMTVTISTNPTKTTLRLASRCKETPPACEVAHPQEASRGLWCRRLSNGYNSTVISSIVHIACLVKFVNVYGQAFPYALLVLAIRRGWKIHGSPGINAHTTV